MSFTYERTSAPGGNGPEHTGESADQTVFRKIRAGSATVPPQRRSAACGPTPRNPSRTVTGPRGTPRPELEFPGITTTRSTALPTAPSMAAPSMASTQPTPSLPTSPPTRHSPSSAGYTVAELAERIGVPAPTLSSWLVECVSYAPFAPDISCCTSTTGHLFRAADVVWFETLARLVRSGTPVARAAAQLRAAKSEADSPYPAPADLPNPRA